MPLLTQVRTTANASAIQACTQPLLVLVFPIGVFLLWPPSRPVAAINQEECAFPFFHTSRDTTVGPSPSPSPAQRERGLSPSDLKWWATLGNLSYGYDAAGRVVQVSGSSATINIPATATATYLNNNQLNAWKGNSASGDANGNLTADRVGHTYYWNERNHLQTVTLSSGGGYLMEYDAFGRRWNLCQGCLSSGTSTPFVYDGLNPVQGNGASMLTGLGLDEYFTRTDSSGTTVDFLRDGLGSTIALTNSSGSSATQYSYEPFGWPTASGTTNSNQFQFTGRKYDSVVVGLYYLRGRYYSTKLQRFVSKDPIGLSGGDANLYRYVGNDPVDFTDRQGLFGGASGVGGGGWYSYPSPHGPGGGPPGSGAPGSSSSGTPASGSFGGVTVSLGGGQGAGGSTVEGSVAAIVAYGNGETVEAGYSFSTEIAGAGIAYVSGFGGGGAPGLLQVQEVGRRHSNRQKDLGMPVPIDELDLFGVLTGLGCYAGGIYGCVGGLGLAAAIDYALRTRGSELGARKGPELRKPRQP